MLPDHVMHDLRYLELTVARRLRSQKVGTYTSRQRGGGFDFDEHRLYREGDDVRRIDWNVTARMNAPFLRETHAERELNVILALDVSRSMAFGTGRQSKKERMLFIAACLVFSAVADQINVGFLAFTDRVVTYRPPRRSRARAWNMLDELWALEPQGRGTAILPAVEYLSAHLNAVSIVFLVSDFVTPEDLASARDLKALALRHDVIAVVLQDPAELALLEARGAVELRDLESGRRVRVGLTRSLKLDHMDAMELRRRELVDTFFRNQMAHVFLRSDQDIVEPLLRLFAARRHA